MKRHHSRTGWYGSAAILVLLVSVAQLCASPLAWFPGPSLDEAMSGAATIVSGGRNILTGGDAFLYYDFPISYPLSLSATDLYWTALAPFYSLNIAPGAVLNDGNLIVYGGSDGTNSQSAVVVYNLTGDTVPGMPPMKAARSYLGYAADKNGNAYAFGGLDENGNALASVERINPANNNPAWAYVASLPTPRYNFPAVFNRTNYIYVFGGRTNASSGSEVASVLRYSVSGNNWSNMAPMPVAVAAAAATLGPDGKIYVVGGLSDGVATDLVQVYNPAANSWSLSTPLPESLSLTAAGVDSLGRLIVMGGMDANGNDVSDVWRSQLLTAPDTVPGFVSYPSLTAAYLVPYVSSITATGNPPPIYLVASGPGGMQVDPYTGDITWTPQANQIGTNSVTLRATNYAGYVDYSFELVVPYPKPSVVTNLTVVNVTESSVTLSWTPEDPVVGPVTYTVSLKHVLHDPKGSGSTVWYTQIGSTTNTSIIISGLAAGLSQGYYVAAIGAGGTSGYAGIGAATLPAPAPTNLRLTGLTSTTIGLAWDAPVGGLPVVSYRILGVYDGVFVQYPLSYVNITNTYFTLTGLSPGTALLLGVCALDSYGNISDYTYLPSLVVNPSRAPAVVTAAAPVAGGGFQFTAALGGSTLQTVLIQATTNPADPASWTQIGSIFPTTSPFTFTDTNATQFPVRFYRVASP